MALHKNATQASTSVYDPPINKTVASRAVDGNTNPRLQYGSVALTSYLSHPWWKVDLHKNYGIARVVVYNRADPCCGSYLKQFIVSLQKDDGSQLSASERTSFENGQLTRAFDWWPPQSSVRYVEISSTASTIMGIAEVQVYSGTETEKEHI